MEILEAKVEDHIVLTQITRLSKAYWNYSDAQMKEWEAVLTITKEYIAANKVYKLVKDDAIIAFYCLKQRTNTETELDYLFVLPEYIGKGYGKLLMDHLFSNIRNTKYESIIVEADPNAEEFYKKSGFVTEFKKESTVKGRYLPVMRTRIKGQ